MNKKYFKIIYNTKIEKRKDLYHEFNTGEKRLPKYYKIDYKCEVSKKCKGKWKVRIHQDCYHAVYPSIRHNKHKNNVKMNFEEAVDFLCRAEGVDKSDYNTGFHSIFWTSHSSSMWCEQCQMWYDYFH